MVIPLETLEGYEPERPEAQQLNFPFDGPLFLATPDELYAGLSLGNIFYLKEDRRIERKHASYSPRSLGEYFSMWANTAPDGGMILLGIDNDGRLSGCKSLAQSELNERESAGRRFCPDSRWESKRVGIVNADGKDDFILALRVFYREDKVVSDVAGNCFTRVGDEKHKLAPDETRELQNDKGQLDLEQEASLLSYPEAFNGPLIQKFCDGVRKTRQLLLEHTNDQILANQRLGKIRSGLFQPNIACELVFSLDPGANFPGCKIRFLRYEGEHEKTGAEYNVVKNIPIEGSVPTVIQEAAVVLRGQLREFSRFGINGKFSSVSEYPEEAWYEAIVNACVHRSYGLRNMNIFVKMFDDRLVIESPGGFPPFVNSENIYESHHPRNPKLMDAMFYLDFVKCQNEGTRRIRDAMNKMSLPRPEFAQKEVTVGYTSVRVTLRNAVKQRTAWVDSDVSRVIGPKLSAGLSDNERRVVNYVAENRSINVTDCQKIVANVKTWHAAKNLLLRLVKKEILIYEHSNDVERDAKACFRLVTELRGEL